jgi:hypothetical protein
MLQGLPHCGQRAVLPYLYYTVSLRIRTKVENNVVPLLAGVKGLKLPLALQRFPIALVYATVSRTERAHTQLTKTVCLVGLALGKEKGRVPKHSPVLLGGIGGLLLYLVALGVRYLVA